MTTPLRSTAPGSRGRSDLPPPSGSGAAPGLAPHWADVIYREMCAERLWVDHYGAHYRAARHHLRQEVPMPQSGQQEDLTQFDYLVEQTVKLFPADDLLSPASQDPNWVPRSMVDEYGRWR